MKIRFVVSNLLTAIALSAQVFALPQFTLISGNKCMNCHFASQGAGIRNELGWYAAKDTRLWSASSVGLSALDSAETNTLAGGALTFGGDVRLQSARSPRSADAQRVMIPMQIAVYAAYQIAPWLAADVMLDGAALYYVAQGKPLPYNGQQAWASSLLFQPSIKLPSLRIGHLRPSIGTLYDDHTMLVRQVPGANGGTLIPPNFAEYGAELNYDGLKWLSLTAGAYLPKSLSSMQTPSILGENVPLLPNTPTDASLIELARAPSLLAKAAFYPRFFDHAVNTYWGASIFANDIFTIANAFAGVGLSDKGALMAEYLASGVYKGRQTRAYSVEFMAQPFVWLLPFVRYEYGTTDLNPTTATQAYTMQVSLGAQFFPLPGVEFRPEYRFINTEGYRSRRWTVQVHLFY